MAEREAALKGFLVSAGWGTAERWHLAGDASDRRYDRLRLGASTAVLMDSPPGGADDPAAFVMMARHLRQIRLSAPEVLAQDMGHGFLLLEDLGDDLFARLLATEPGREPMLYASATDCLLHLQASPSPEGLANLSAADWAAAAGFALDCYTFAATGIAPERDAFLAAMTKAILDWADGPRVLILRDFHAENLLWLPDRAGVGRVGLLDFQLGQLGQPGYDLVSLLQDARRDVDPETERAMLARFCAACGIAPDRFAAHYAVLGAQRALRIIGVFARLCLKAGKPGYLRLIPRVWAQLQRNLEHPALADLARVCNAVLPPPTPEILLRIENQCLTSPSR